MISKLGWHVIHQFADPGDMARLNHAAAIKIVGDASISGRLNELAARYPSKMLIARRIDLEKTLTNPLDMVAHLNEYATDFNLRQVWWETFHNEPAMTGDVAAWDAETLYQARARRLKMIAGNFSQGYPGVGRFVKADNPDLWKVYYPALREIHKSGAGWARLGMHNYIAGAALEPGEMWNATALRHDELYRAHLDPNGWGDIRVVSTEAGFDAPNRDEARLSPEQTIGAWKQLDALLMSDYRVVAHLLYTLNLASKQDPNNIPFELHGPIFEQVTAYQAGLMGGPSQPPIEVPPPAPQPQPGMPGTPYRATLTRDLNARLGTTDTSPYLATLPPGAEVTVLDDSGPRSVIQVSVLKNGLKRA